MGQLVCVYVPCNGVVASGVWEHRRGWLGDKETRTKGMGGGQKKASDAWNNAFSRKTRSTPVADGVHRRA